MLFTDQNVLFQDPVEDALEVGVVAPTRQSGKQAVKQPQALALGCRESDVILL